MEVKGIRVEAGLTYTLDIHGVKNAVSGWSSNSAELTGPWYRNGKFELGTLPAVRIIGN